MAEWPHGKEDEAELRWRRLSRNLILELDEKILKRRTAFLFFETPDEMSTASEEDNTNGSSKSNEYHRKKLLEAELKFKMLEGFDTLSESSSVSSACFQELEVREGSDERTFEDNVNSHNSGADGRSDSGSISYSNSFSASIDEEIESNSSDEEIESTDLNFGSTPVGYATESEADLLLNNPDAVGEHRTRYEKSINHSVSCREINTDAERLDGVKEEISQSSEVLNQRKESFDLACSSSFVCDKKDDLPQVGEPNAVSEPINASVTTLCGHMAIMKNKYDKQILTTQSSYLIYGNEEDDTANRFRGFMENNTRVPGNPHVDEQSSFPFSSKDNDSNEPLEVFVQNHPIAIQAPHRDDNTNQHITHKSHNTTSMHDGGSSPITNNDNCRSIDDLFDTVGFMSQHSIVGNDEMVNEIEIKTHESDSKNVSPKVPPNNNIRSLTSECATQIKSVSHDLKTLCNEDILANFIDETRTNNFTKLNKSEGITASGFSFQNISCNKGSPSNENVRTVKKNVVTTALPPNHQSLLKETFNIPLKRCIDKARLVTSIKESLDKARSIKEKLAGKAAYDKAVKEFTTAVDSLLEERQHHEDDDVHLVDDNTYSMDDNKVNLKKPHNSIDVLRTPIAKRRLAIEQNIPNKNNKDAGPTKKGLHINQHSFDVDCKVEDASNFKRDNTFIICPRSNSTDFNNIYNDFSIPEECETCINSYHDLNNEKLKDVTRYTDINDIPNKETLNAEMSLGYNSHDELITPRDEIRNNDDTAYVSDLDISPLIQGDKTYNKYDNCGNIDAATEERNNRTFDINKDDEYNHDRSCQSSSEETLNIVESFCNAEDFLNADDDTVSNKRFVTSENPKDVHTEEPLRQMKDENIFGISNLCNSVCRAYEVDDTNTLNVISGYDECLILDPDNEEKGVAEYFEVDAHGYLLNASNSDTKITIPLTENAIAFNNRENYEVDYDASGKDTIHLHETNYLNKHIDSPSKVDALPHKSEDLKDKIMSVQLFTNNDIDLPMQRLSLKDLHTDVTANEKLSEMESKSSYNDVVSNIPRNTRSGEVTHVCAGYFSPNLPMKTEMCDDESPFSITSSTSGEYSLRNQGTLLKSNGNADLPEQLCTNLKHDGDDLKPNQELSLYPPNHDIDKTKFITNYTPIELVVREKSANDIKEICVANRQIMFRQLNEDPTATVIQGEQCSPGEKEYFERMQQIPIQNSDINFENSMCNLRKAAHECLRPLREKVAFFENIEKTFQCSNTLQCQDIPDSNVYPATIQPNQDQLLVNKESFNANGQPSQIPYGQMCLKSENIAVKSTKDVHVQVEEKVLDRQIDSQKEFVQETSETRHPCDYHKGAFVDIIGAVEDLKTKVIESNNLVLNLTSSFQGALQIASSERERLRDGLDSTKCRIKSNEEVVSNLEKSTSKAVEESGSALKRVQTTLHELRGENSDNLQRFSTDIETCKEDFQATVEKLAANFQEQITSVVSEMLQERPAPSCSVHDSANKRDVDDLRLRIVEMKNARDAEKMYHKITRESLRALERDHDRLRHEMLLSATRRRLGDSRRKLSHHQFLVDKTLPSKTTNIEPDPITSTPKSKGADNPQASTDTSGGSRTLKSLQTECDEQLMSKPRLTSKIKREKRFQKFPKPSSDLNYDDPR